MVWDDIGKQTWVSWSFFLERNWKSDENPPLNGGSDLHYVAGKVGLLGFHIAKKLERLEPGTKNKTKAQRNKRNVRSKRYSDSSSVLSIALFTHTWVVQHVILATETNLKGEDERIFPSSLGFP